jgi:hypothetical protein
MNRLPYNLANQRSHIRGMAIIALIIIGVISFLGKQNKLTREVFWWLVAGREHLMFFLPKKPKMIAGRWCTHHHISETSLPLLLLAGPIKK